MTQSTGWHDVTYRPIIRFEWWVPPPSEKDRLSFYRDAWNTATRPCNWKSIKQILIRSYPHDTTYKGGVLQPDQEHISISVKTTTDVPANIHATIHGYYKYHGSEKYIEWTKKVGRKADNAIIKYTDSMPGHPAWPNGLDYEVVDMTSSTTLRIIESSL